MGSSEHHPPAQQTAATQEPARTGVCVEMGTVVMGSDTVSLPMMAAIQGNSPKLVVTAPGVVILMLTPLARTRSGLGTPQSPAV